MNIWEVIELMEWMIRSKWKDVIYIKKCKKLNQLTTGDLDSDGKLNPNYLELRERRKKKKDESKPFAFSDKGIDDIWGD